jgi:cell shape-determining protein MreD
MRYWIGAAVAFMLAIVQASSMEQFKILDVSPNLLLVMLCGWLVVRGLDDVLPMLLVAGITFGLVGLQSPGVVLLALLPIAAFGLLRELHIIHSDLVLMLIIVAGSTIAYEIIMTASVMATGGVFDPQAAFEAAVVPAVIVNVCLTPFVFIFMRLLRVDSREGRLSF